MWRRHSIGALLFLLIIAGWATVDQMSYHLSDKSLTKYYQQHRAEFNELASMSNEDASVRLLTPNYVKFNDYTSWPENCGGRFSWRRRIKYKDVFGNLREYDIDRFSRQSNILFIPVSTDISELNGDAEYNLITKGYAYSLAEPSPLVDSLGWMGFDNQGTSYKKIDEHWYLSQEWSTAKPE